MCLANFQLSLRDEAILNAPGVGKPKNLAKSVMVE
jgi:hypothetical protein